MDFPLIYYIIIICASQDYIIYSDSGVQASQKEDIT